MTDLMTTPTPASAHPTPAVHNREGTTMLLHEALARCRHQEALRAAREFRLARSVTAGRRWTLLARFAARRAERARAGLDVPTGHHRVSGLRSAF
ncbi:MAG: hypothetical protein QOG20_2833 [Pseudonocardiales bacterium]|jgi:hypothetical protein|nr:hypothetical protein [Pseudonocardiales bacterium]